MTTAFTGFGNKISIYEVVQSGQEQRNTVSETEMQLAVSRLQTDEVNIRTLSAAEKELEWVELTDGANTLWRGFVEQRRNAIISEPAATATALKDKLSAVPKLLEAVLKAAFDSYPHRSHWEYIGDAEKRSDGRFNVTVISSQVLYGGRGLGGIPKEKIVVVDAMGVVNGSAKAPPVKVVPVETGTTAAERMLNLLNEPGKLEPLVVMGFSSPNESNFPIRITNLKTLDGNKFEVTLSRSEALGLAGVTHVTVVVDAEGSPLSAGEPVREFNPLTDRFGLPR